MSSSGKSPRELEAVLRCRFCWRTSKDRKPCLARHQSEFLVFDQVDKKACLLCKAFIKTCYKGHSISEMSQACATVAFRDQLVSSLRSYENELEASKPGGRVRNVAEKCSPPVLVQACEEHALVGEMNLGVFWPKQLHETKEKPNWSVRMQCGILSKERRCWGA